MNYYEANFDGLIGPTHNFAGLADGNIASMRNAKHISNPKKAALEGLNKMQVLSKMGYKQGFFPPQERPRIDLLRNLGFTGSDTDVLRRTSHQSPNLLPIVYSASSMWAANSATVTPSPDSADGKVHLTPANLNSSLHRSLEHAETHKMLDTIFSDKEHFKVHGVLHTQQELSDEGAANHTRLCGNYGDKGLSVFVYGRNGKSDQKQRFPSRQSLLASQAIARQHGCLDRTLFLQQSQTAIEAGAFHNDVVAVGNGPVLFYHQDAFDIHSKTTLENHHQNDVPLTLIEVPRHIISLEKAISTYLFNSQLLSTSQGDHSNMTLLCPQECQEEAATRDYLAQLCENPKVPINKVVYVNVRQSMKNGGGPACLRLRVVLSEQELNAVDQRFIMCDEKYRNLKAWIEKYYRDQLSIDDLADPEFYNSCQEALEALTKVLDLGNYYKFQQYH